MLAALGVRFDPLQSQFRPPGEATIRRILESVDAGQVDAAITCWLASHASAEGPARGRRRAVAVDGKALRGTRHSSRDGQAAHLLAAIDQQARTVLAQTAVDGKTNEITRFAPLLWPLDLAGCVITADALHTQREHAEHLVTGQHADYILVVKGNQPSLHAQLRKLPWKTPRRRQSSRPRPWPARTPHPAGGHRRRRARLPARRAGPAGDPADPAAARRKMEDRHRLPITSLAFGQATPAELAGWIRGHWQIEALHHIRSPGTGPAVASCGAGATRVSFSC